MNLKNLVSELRDLGPLRTGARLVWEARTRSRFDEVLDAAFPRRRAVREGDLSASALSTAISSPADVRGSMVPFVSAAAMEELRRNALDAAEGRLLCFGAWYGDFGKEIDWALCPVTGFRQDTESHWSVALRKPQLTDIKLTWEAGRFPHAYLMARAAAFQPDLAGVLSASLNNQIERFTAANHLERGIHWASSQEVVIRVMSWMFAHRVFAALGFPLNSVILANAVYEMAAHVQRFIFYSKHCVYNNHLVSEAFGLLLGAALLPGIDCARDWRAAAAEILQSEARSQVASDGGYIQNSHNYHRMVVQTWLLSYIFDRTTAGEDTRSAMARSLDFLLAHQNGSDGRLPNYGANDGGLPALLSTCDYSDFRPTLQAVSIATRGERIYPEGPWDEEAVWLLGKQSLGCPLRKLNQTSVSFAVSGYQVLRGKSDGSFAAFRCGSVTSRFSQIDMLHLDVWWRGLNVLVDPGTYLYNGPARWHDYFYRAASHNTATVDGLDPMLHYRKWKNLYWTEASLLSLHEDTESAGCQGEHYGFRRHSGHCVHRRSVHFMKDEIWIVVDSFTGTGEHSIRLHWLGGQFSFEQDTETNGMILHTPEGNFTTTAMDGSGKPLDASIVAGSEDPIRGWLSRYYGEKVPVPSMAIDVHQILPIRIVSILAGGKPSISVTDGIWNVASLGVGARFAISEAGDVQVGR